MRDTHIPVFFLFFTSIKRAELVSELFEQAQPCMNSNRGKEFLFIAFLSCFTERVQEMLLT